MTSISVSEQREAIVDALSVEGVKTKFKRWPREIQNNQLPAVLLSVGEGSYRISGQALGSRELVIERNFTLWLYAQRLVQGQEYAAEEAAEPYLTRVPDALAALRRLTTSEDDGERVFDVLIEGGSDSGLEMMEYAGQQYVGMSVRLLTVTEEPIEVMSV